MGVVREAMNPVLLSIGPERAIADAARAMSERRVHHLLVMRRGDLVGVVCTCDVKGAGEQHATVAQVMSKRVLSFPADGTIDDAVNTMLSEHIGFLPVLDNGAIIGVITRGDLARVLGADRERSLMLACKWCHSHRHVNFRPMHAAPICDDCLAEEDADLGEGD